MIGNGTFWQASDNLATMGIVDQSLSDRIRSDPIRLDLVAPLNRPITPIDPMLAAAGKPASILIVWSRSSSDIGATSSDNFIQPHQFLAGPREQADPSGLD